MINSENEVIDSIFELMSTGFEACDYISNQLNNNSSNNVIELLLNLNNMLNSILDNILKFELKHNFIKNIILNIYDYIDKIIDHIKLGNIKKAQIDFDFVLYGLYCRLNEELYINLIVLNNDDAFRNHYDEEFTWLDEIRRTNGEVIKEKNKRDYKYKVSIYVPVYNSKEYTKECIESIYKYTEGIGTKYELIIRSDGSTDGVNEYLETLDIDKKLIFKHNLRLGYEISYAIEGEYVVNVSNDVVVTNNWLDNLLKCIESDEKIGMVVPTTNQLTNFQTIPVEYSNMKEMQEFACKYNVSDSLKWVEREKLINFVSIVRTDLDIREDLAMTYGHFADDDICLRVRRAGYKLINAKDTFVHHYGSASYAAIAGESYVIMEAHLIKKHGFSTWGLNSANINVEEWIDSNYTKKENINVLYIGDDLGKTALSVKENLKFGGAKNIDLYGALYSEKYLPYLQASYKESVLFDNIKQISHIKMDYIIISNLGDLGINYINKLYDLKQLLNDNGKLFFYVDNIMYLRNIIASFNGLIIEEYASPENSDSSRFCYFNVDRLYREIDKKFKIENVYNFIYDYNNDALELLVNYISNISCIDKNCFIKNQNIINYVFQIS